MHASPLARRRTRRVAGPAFLAWALLVAAAAGIAPTAGADIVRLRTGETVKGRILADRTNEEILVVEDYLAGATREFAWSAVDPEDAARIKPALNLGGVGEESIVCDLVTFRLDSGQTVSLKCVIEKEDAGAVYVRTLADRSLRVDKARIVSRAKGECEPQEIYRPAELAEMFREEMAPSDARTWFLFAQRCERVGAYAAARDGYEAAASDDTYLRRKQAQDGAARMESILRDQDAVNEILQLRQAVASSQWKRVRDAIEAFPSKHPTIGDAAKKRLEDLKKYYETRRTAFFTSRVADRLEKIVRDDLIKKRVAPKDAEFNDIQGWLRRGALEDGFNALLAELQRSDPSVTAEEAKAFWEGREKRSWRTAKYASGTRFFYPPKILPKTGSRQTQPQGRSQGGPAPVLKLPEPPQRDQWWKDLALDERVALWWAVFVEKSGLFEVDVKQVKQPCPRCDAEGVQNHTLSNGMQATTLCVRCAGARYDIAVRYR